MTDDELRKLAEAALRDDRTTTPAPWSRAFGSGSISAGDKFITGGTWPADGGFIIAARTREPELARAVLRLLEERDTWKDNASTWLDQEMTSPQIWRAQKAVIEAARNVVKDSGDLRELEGPVCTLEEAERDT